MGSWLSYLWWGGEPDIPHSVSGLSRRDIHIIQKTWAPVYADTVGSGAELFIRLFRANPETKQFFKVFSRLSEEELAESVQFKAHVINVMTSLNMAIVNLHQPEIVVAMMDKLGESHGNRHIKKQHFDDLKLVMVQMLTDVLDLNEASLGAWERTVDFWYKHIFEKLQTKES